MRVGRRLRMGAFSLVALVPALVSAGVAGEPSLPRVWTIAEGPGQVKLVAPLGDGRLVVAVAADHVETDARVRVWDMLTGKAVATLEGPNRRVNAVAVAPGAGLVAVDGGDADEYGAARIFVCEARTGKLVHRLEGAPGGLRALRFTLDGVELVGAGEHLVDEHGDLAAPEAHAKWGACFAARWEVTTGRSLGWKRLEVDSGSRLAIAPDGKTIAVAGSTPDGPCLAIVDSRSGQVVACQEAPHPSPVSAIVFSVEGDRLATVSAEPMGGFGGMGPRRIPPELKVWDVTEAGFKERRRIGLNSPWATRLSFRPGGKQLAMIDGNVTLWDIDSGRRTADLGLPSGLGSGGFDAAFTTRGDALLVAGSGGLGLWDPDRVVQLAHIRTPEVQCVRFAEDGKALLAGLDDGRLVALDLREERDTIVMRLDDERVTSLVPRPGTDAFAVGGMGRVSVFEPDTGELRWVVPAASREAGMPLTGLAWLPDGRALLELRADGSLTRRRIDLVPSWMQGPEWRRELEAGHARAMALAPTGTYLALAGTDGVVRLLSPGTGEERRELLRLTRRVARNKTREVVTEDGQTVISHEVVPGEFHDVPVPIDLLHFSPDGKTLAVATNGFENRVRLHDVETGVERARYMQWYGMHPEMSGIIYAIAFTPDGSLMASSSRGSVMLADPADGSIRAVLPGRGIETIKGLAFSPDGRTLAAGGEGEVRIWDVERAIREWKPPEAGGGETR